MDAITPDHSEDFPSRQVSEAYPAFRVDQPNSGLSFSDFDPVQRVKDAELAAATHLFQMLFGGVENESTENGLNCWKETFSQVRAVHPQMSYKDVLITSIRTWLTSEEFKGLYGANSNTEYLVTLYINILGRLPDQEGFDHWLGQLEHSALTREQLFAEFTKSSEFKFEFDVIDLLKTGPADGDQQPSNNRGTGILGIPLGGNLTWPTSSGAVHSGTDMFVSVGDVSALPIGLSASAVSFAVNSAIYDLPHVDRNIVSTNCHIDIADVPDVRDDSPFGEIQLISGDADLPGVYRLPVISRVQESAQGVSTSGNRQATKADGQSADAKAALAKLQAAAARPDVDDIPQSSHQAANDQYPSTGDTTLSFLSDIAIQPAVSGTENEIVPNIVYVSSLSGALSVQFDLENDLSDDVISDEIVEDIADEQNNTTTATARMFVGSSEIEHVLRSMNRL